MATIFSKRAKASKYGTSEETTSLLSVDVAPLGVPPEEKRFWWQRRKPYDLDAIATQAGLLFAAHINDDEEQQLTPP